MKTLKLFMLFTMIGTFGSTFAQTTKPAAKAETKPSVYFASASLEQCMTFWLDEGNQSCQV
jgi:hypothetical protein